MNGRVLIYERKFSRSKDYRVEAHDGLSAIGFAKGWTAVYQKRHCRMSDQAKETPRKPSQTSIYFGTVWLTGNVLLGFGVTKSFNSGRHTRVRRMSDPMRAALLLSIITIGYCQLSIGYDI